MVLHQGSMFGIIAEGGRLGGELEAGICKLSGRVKCKMTRSAAGLDRNERGIVRGEDSRGGIKLINQNLVEAEIGHEGIAPGRVQDNRMRMGCGLSSWNHTGTGVLVKGGDGFYGSVFCQRQGGTASAAIVGDEYIASRRVDGEVARAGALTGLHVHKFKCSRCRVNLERADRSTARAFIAGWLADGVEVVSIGVEDDESRAHCFGCQRGFGKLTRIQIQNAGENSLLLTRRARTEIDADLFLHRIRCCQCGKN